MYPVMHRSCTKADVIGTTFVTIATVESHALGSVLPSSALAGGIAAKLTIPTTSIV
jgi:hypothetical protein